MIGNFRLPTSSIITNSLVPIGTIFEKNTFSDSSDFTLFGNATATASGGELILTTTTQGVFTNGLTLNKTTGLNKYKITALLKIISAPGGVNYGYGLGIKSINANYKAHAIGRQANDNTGGSTFFNLGPSYSSIATGSQPVATNNIIEIIFEQRDNVITCSIWNKTQNIGKSNIFGYQSIGYTYQMPNIGNPCINLLGGTFNLMSFKFESADYFNAKIMCVGDSKTQGYAANDIYSSYAYQLESKYIGVSNNSGGNDESSHVLSKIQEIIDFAPKKVLLNIGSNDKRYGRTYATWEANYDSIVSQLITAGIDVFHLLQLNETSLTFTDYNTHITSTYPSGKIINAGTISLNSDGVHPNQTGHNQIYDAIVAQIGGQII